MDFEIINEIENFRDQLQKKRRKEALPYREIQVEVIDNSIFLYVICPKKDHAEQVMESVELTPYNHINKHKILDTNIKSKTKASFVIHRYNTTELKKLNNPKRITSIKTLKQEIENQPNIIVK